MQLLCCMRLLLLLLLLLLLSQNDVGTSEDELKVLEKRMHVLVSRQRQTVDVCADRQTYHAHLRRLA